MNKDAPLQVVSEPELPEAAASYMRGCNVEIADGTLLYTAEQMKAYARAVLAVAQQESETIAAAHDYLRGSLKLPEDAPRRFDYYAQVIAEKSDKADLASGAAGEQKTDSVHLTRAVPSEASTADRSEGAA